MMDFLLCASGIGEYEPGDIIDIKASGFIWGTDEWDKPVFVLVDVEDEDIGTVENARNDYLPYKIFYCYEHLIYLEQHELYDHIIAEHANIYYVDQPNVRKTINELNIDIIKGKKWFIDGQELKEKKPKAGDKTKLEKIKSKDIKVKVKDKK
jgi:hypothetical protein